MYLQGDSENVLHFNDEGRKSESVHYRSCTGVIKRGYLSLKSVCRRRKIETNLYLPYDVSDPDFLVKDGR